MKNVQTGHSTRLIILQLKLDSAVPESVFTQNFLNTGKIVK
ncbi:MAG: outer membrane lipoprotein-sorting protein [Spirochaetia bacterium]|nr:outer membrane lipoprotein-sorting protein [Spirochaetia bacterium]